MRILSGVTDQYIYFVAVDATDLKTRETGLATWTVYRSRNGGAAAAFTTPTINETDNTNMPGVYELLLDEDMTIDAGDDSQEMVFHITHTGMAPVTRTIELYRAKITAGNTLGVEADGDLTKVNTLDGHTAQTGDAYARLGAPAGASVSADVAAVKVDTAAILVDTGTTLDGKIDTIDTNVDAILVDTGTTLDGKIDTIDTNVDAILVDTGTTLDGKLDTIDTNVDSILADTGTDGVVVASIAANAITATAIAADAIDAASLATDAVTEIVNGVLAGEITELISVPAASPTLEQALALSYMALRNRRETTADADEIQNDAGTAVGTATLSDDGTTFTKGEYA